MFLEWILLGLACLMSPWLAKLAGFETHRKPFHLVAAAGIFFLLGVSIGLGINMSLMLIVDVGKTLMFLSFAVGYIGLAVGALWALLEVVREPGSSLIHKTV